MDGSTIPMTYQRKHTQGRHAEEDHSGPVRSVSTSASSTRSFEPGEQSTPTSTAAATNTAPVGSRMSEISPSLKAVAFGRNYFYSLGGTTPTLRKESDASDKDEKEEQQISRRHSHTTTLRYEWDVPFWAKESASKQPRSKIISLRNGRNANNKSNDRSSGESGEQTGVIQAVATAQSTLFLTFAGKVYQTGTLHGQVSVHPTALAIPLPIPCVELAAGRHFCLARMQGGIAVCSWGAGHFGQLVSRYRWFSFQQTCWPHVS